MDVGKRFLEPGAVQKDIAKLAVAIALLYALLSPLEPPDFEVFLYPWLEHIHAHGPVGAFAEPFANYTPPYLYLLTAFSLLGLSPLVTIKLLSIAILGFLSFAALKLAKVMGADEPAIAAMFVLALPTVIFNGPALGQCDSLWVAACVLSLAAAVEGKVMRMALWAGIAFAFKAQAAFFAPFALGFVISRKAWSALLIPPAVYLAAIAPAWLAGWPLSDLLTVYLQQAAASASAPFQGNAPNLWALPVAMGLGSADLAAYIAAAAAALAVAAYVARRHLSSEGLLLAALLCSLLVPFLLPKMHERYFFLADILAFSLAYLRRDPLSIALCVLVQAGSTFSIVAYLGPLPWLNVAGSAMMAAGLGLVIRLVVVSHRESAKNSLLYPSTAPLISTGPAPR